MKLGAVLSSIPNSIRQFVAGASVMCRLLPLIPARIGFAQEFVGPTSS